MLIMNVNSYNPQQCYMVDTSLSPFIDEIAEAQSYRAELGPEPDHPDRQSPNLKPVITYAKTFFLFFLVI